MTRPSFYIMLLLLYLYSCNSRVNDSNVVVTERLFSPDSSYVAFTYYVDNGAMGQSMGRASLMKIEDTLGNLNDHLLPCFDLPVSCYFPDTWLDAKTLQVTLYERPFVRAGRTFPAVDTFYEGICLKVKPYDRSYESSPLIEHISFSPDRKRLMVAYRYDGIDNDISVISYQEPLPRIGNIYTIIGWDPVVFGKWNGEGIDLFMHQAKMYKLSNYLNKGIKVPVRFVDITKFKGELGDSSYWVNSKLYQDSYIDTLLTNKGITTTASIVMAQRQMKDNKECVYYEYEYTVNGRTYRSYFRIPTPINQDYDYEKGDSIEVIYDPAQPLIHRTKENYSR